MPIRVLNLFTVLNRGGAETMCMNLYRHIDRSKVQFDFLVYHEERGIYEDEIEMLGGHVYRIPHLKNLPAHIRGAKLFFANHKDFTVIHNHMQCNGAFICKEAKQTGIKTIIYHSHAGPLSVFSSGLKVALRRIIDNTNNRIALRNSTDFFACGETAAMVFPKKIKEITIIRNAIDLDSFCFNAETRDRVRTERDCQNKLVIGNVARFDANKNQSFAIDIIAELAKRNIDAVLWLVGDGTLKQQIEAKAKEAGVLEKVRFWGVRTDVNELLQAMDVYLFPSIAEGLSVSCIEAQATGLPCVFSDGFDPHTAITDKCAILSLNEPVNVWADTIIKMSQIVRKDTIDVIRNAGYDIEDTVAFMQDYYLSKATINV